MSRLESLVINKNGFVFDQFSGESYVLNESAKFIVELLKSEVDATDVAKKLSKEFDVTFDDAYIDVLDLKNKLKLFGLV